MYLDTTILIIRISTTTSHWCCVLYNKYLWWGITLTTYLAAYVINTECNALCRSSVVSTNDVMMNTISYARRHTRQFQVVVLYVLSKPY